VEPPPITVIFTLLLLVGAAPVVRGPASGKILTTY